MESLILPTYEMDPDDPNPFFKGFDLPGFKLFRSDRSVYPYPFADRFTRRRVERTYQAVTLENEYLRVTVLPELRGRVQGAVDKRNNWEFIYFNHVIKPADISIRAAWLSGGLEWNHPGGHGYTQLTPVSYRLLDEPDGGKTVVVSEIEPVRMMQWETAITLRPGSLALETTGRFFGINAAPVPFASSLNAAMHATDEMQMIYPAGTYITGHGKRSLHAWPVIDGVDYSWIKNLDHTLSIFSENVPASFFGCYSHDKKAGSVIVTDRRTAPGQKYFAWGWAPDGRRWDTLLSDNDGPYIELQVGAFWDNLGYGYAWLDPLEVKEFTASWYPVMDMEGFVAAGRDVCMNVLVPADNQLDIRLQGTREIENLRLQVMQDGRVLHEDSITVQPAKPLAVTVPVPPGSMAASFTVMLLDAAGHEMLRYNTAAPRPDPPVMPERSKPMEQMSLDELYAKGQSFYQDPYSTDAESYYEAMLARDPDESRALRALGVIALQRGQYDLAVKRLQDSFHADPLNGGAETQYYLGLCAQAKEDWKEAQQCFEAAARFQRWAGPALYGLGCAALRRGNADRAAGLFREAAAVSRAPRAWAAAAIAERMAGRAAESRQALDQALARNPLDFTALAEEWLCGDRTVQELHGWFDRKDRSFLGTQLYLETAKTYMELGCWQDAVRLLTAGMDHQQQSYGRTYPLLAYYRGYGHCQLGESVEAAGWYDRAAQMKPDYCFPYHPLSIKVLQDALRHNPTDSRGMLYLGNLYFYLRRYQEARNVWERAVWHDKTNAMLHRNLANAVWAKDRDLTRATTLMEQAVRYNPEDGRLLFELDHLYAAAGRDDLRLSMLKQHRRIALSRDDLVMRWAALCLRKQQYAETAALMDTTWFYAREASSHVHAVYAEAHYGLAEQHLAAGRPKQAMMEIDKGLAWPDHLSEGMPAGEVPVRAWYLKAQALDAAGDATGARELRQKIINAVVPDGSEAWYYQALAHRSLGDKAQSEKLLYSLTEEAQATIDRDPSSAVAWYLSARAAEALGNPDEAAQMMHKAVNLDADVVLQARIAAAALKHRQI